MVSLIAAMDLNGCIGKDGGLPWGRSFPEDLQRFKRITEGHAVLMGSKTAFSLPGPLSNRDNLVLTKNPTHRHACYEWDEDIIDSTMPEFESCTCFLPLLSGFTFVTGLEETCSSYGSLFIIGGGALYESALALQGLVDRMCITTIDAEYEGDTYFPDINWCDWLAGPIEVGSNPLLTFQEFTVRSEL